ncbi:aspartate/glutamate racemase family protein [Gaoshiqia sediminis]|uniref:Amino acid racemase n=1 Tax=Gaoshiqia sediminis TaxID=2986998 RepID=A0AA42C841_9BACT|nr:amino acid racemase [Gaoshiqia sediminis]MCW0482296.1 amino acid racemase [Gaoshiqia sediminis]
MKTIGILGGLGPEATIDYYKEIIDEFNQGSTNLNYPEILIYSVNMAKFIGMLEQADYHGASRYLAGCINKLAEAGADFAAMSANTPHLLFSEIQDQTTIPLISIVETCKNRAKELGLKRCGLFGTKFTMKSSFFSESFAHEHIEIFTPEPRMIERIHLLLFSELELGIFKEETRAELLSIVCKMINDFEIDSLILGCTEFPIMFPEEYYLNIPFLNTTRIHVREIVKQSFDN